MQRPLKALLAVALIALHGAALGALPAQPLPLANEALLRSARLWEAQQRGDLALLALKKLVSARPDAPQALQELGELALRMNDMDTATWSLQHLQQRFAGTSYARTFAQSYRLQTSDRLRLASLQRLIQMNRLREASAELTRLFPDGAPDGYLGIQYYNLMARLPGTWQRVREGLHVLSVRHADDARYEFALAEHLLRREDTVLQGLHRLQALAQRSDVRSSEVDAAAIPELLKLGPERAPPDLLQAYVQRHPDDAAATQLLNRIITRQREAQRWWRNALQMLRPDATPQSDVQVQAMLGELRKDTLLDDLLQTWHQLDRDTPIDRDATLNRLVTQWRAQGLAALQQQQVAAAVLNLKIALALKRREFENTIALAEQLQAAGRVAESGELLASAAELDPQSSWLFETRVRWLIDQNQPNAALSLLETRTPDEKYAAATRDALRAAALQQRAGSAAPTQALADLQQALALSPDDVWLRYRLANAHAALGDTARGAALMNEGALRQPGNVELRYAQALYLSGINEDAAALDAIQAVAQQDRTTDMLALEQRIHRAGMLSQVNTLLEQQRTAEAAAVLDELITVSESNRGLRIWRAELEQRMNRPRAARDRLAVLVAEDPDDLAARLAYVRALTDSGDLSLARLQLQAAQQRAKPGDATVQLDIAQRAWALNDADAASTALRPVLPQLAADADAWLLAGRSELALRNFSTAHDYLQHAEQLNAAASAEARRLRAELDERLQSSFATAVLTRHKPGDAGISQFDAVTWANAWHRSLNYEQRFTLRADAVSLRAGDLDPLNATAMFGTRYLAGNADLHRNRTQRGVALGLIHSTDFFITDIGTTPLGFALPNIVGGIAWRPALESLDLAVGVERRAVTSSVLSFAGMSDPVSGDTWGGVVATGPYIQAGVYRELYSVSGALRAAQLTGKNVLSNRLLSARVSGDWRWINSTTDRSWLGLTLNYWNYQHNLQAYTFGSGGYYSPQSYLSVALPLEWQGRRHQWSYQARAALAYTHSRTQQTAWFPAHAELQQQAAALAQANSDGEPFFSGERGHGTSFSASARVERALGGHFVIGAQFSMDRADYYHPVDLAIYLRRVFGASASPALPPQPLRPYND